MGKDIRSCRFSTLSFCKLSSAARGRSTISVAGSAHERRFVVSIFEQVGSEMGICQFDEQSRATQAEAISIFIG
jgi:hypothetical protein